MVCAFLRKGSVRNYDDAKKSDTKMFARYHAAMLGEGVLLAPSQFEAAFVSLAHNASDLSKTALAAEKALKKAAQ